MLLFYIENCRIHRNISKFRKIQYTRVQYFGVIIASIGHVLFTSKCKIKEVYSFLMHNCISLKLADEDLLKMLLLQSDP